MVFPKLLTSDPSIWQTQTFYFREVVYVGALTFDLLYSFLQRLKQNNGK